MSNVSQTTSNGSTSSSTLENSDLQHAIRLKNSEHTKGVEQFRSLVLDLPENDSLHENLESFINHKYRMIMGLAKELKPSKTKAPYVPDDTPGLMKTVVIGLLEYHRDMKACLKKNEEELVKCNNELASLVKEIETLKTVGEKRAVPREMLSFENLQEKMLKTDREFARSKKLLNEIIYEIFPDKHRIVHDLLGSLSDALFESEGGDGYISVDKINYSIVELLIDGNIVKRHPYDKTKIKLADL